MILPPAIDFDELAGDSFRLEAALLQHAPGRVVVQKNRGLKAVEAKRFKGIGRHKPNGCGHEAFALAFMVNEVANIGKLANAAHDIADRDLPDQKVFSGSVYAEHVGAVLFGVLYPLSDKLLLAV
ncbi:hypothetical protein D3C73_1370890 [compost metagenome]